MNIFFKLSLCIILLNSVVACSQETNTSTNNILSKLSTDDRNLINQYEDIITSISKIDKITYQKNLKSFLPKAQRIQNNVKRNEIIMTIYLHTEQFNEALNFNKKLIKKNPERIAFQCTLLETLDKEEYIKKQCYEESAKFMKKELDAFPRDDKNYESAEFLYFLEMYRAGHIEYKEKMKESINSMKNEDFKDTATYFYDNPIFTLKPK